jgi:hypothetical protein
MSVLRLSIDFGIASNDIVRKLLLSLLGTA